MIKTAERHATLRLPDELKRDIDSIAEKKGKSRNDIITEACRMYRDCEYMSGKATVIPEHILNTLKAIVSGMEDRLNIKSNQLLSSIAIELYVIQHILADNLDLDPNDVAVYRTQAIDVLKRNNRIFRMDEII